MMGVELGRIGIWAWQFWGERADVVDAAAELDELGYGAVWFPNGPTIFERSRELLEATRRLVVAPGIVSIWTHTPEAAASAHHELTRDHPGRFLLGLGVSHQHLVDRDEPGRYSRPVTRMREYLDALDAAPTPVPADQRILAALGPRMLDLARERSAGAHPYLVTAEHTEIARRALGPDRTLAVEQAVVLETDPVRARQLGREHITFYLRAPNYTNNWLRLGFAPGDLENGGSDRLVDALVAWGDTDAIRERVAAHHRAGADHVCLQVITDDRTALPRAEWRSLAAALI
jgi:probable F420-dependent oxidoreductase